MKKIADCKGQRVLQQKDSLELQPSEEKKKAESPNGKKTFKMRCNSALCRTLLGDLNSSDYSSGWKCMMQQESDCLRQTQT